MTNGLGNLSRIPHRKRKRNALRMMRVMRDADSQAYIKGPRRDRRRLLGLGVMTDGLTNKRRVE